MTYLYIFEYINGQWLMTWADAVPACQFFANQIMAKAGGFAAAFCYGGHP